MSEIRRILDDHVVSGSGALEYGGEQLAQALKALGNGLPMYLGRGQYLASLEEQTDVPLVLKPEHLKQGTEAAVKMLVSDLPLHQKIAAQPGKQEEWQPVSAPSPICTKDNPTGTDVWEAVEFAQGRETNIVLPPIPPKKEKEKKEEGWEFKAEGPGRKTQDGGVQTGVRRDVREYIKSGYTRRNPNGTRIVDDDFKGKWEDGFSIAKAGVEKKLFDASVADGSFGGKEDFISGKGKVLSASGKAAADAEWTSKGLKAQAGAEAKGSFLEGSAGTDEDNLMSGKVEGSAVSAKAEAKAEVVLTAEQATLGGKLGASVHLIEAAFSGKVTITPKRVVDPAIQVWNYFVEDDVEPLHECWDIGITGDAKASGQVGFGAEADGKIGHEKGNLRAEAGAKATAGVGGGFKVGLGTTGVDKYLDGTCNWKPDWW
ncbi:hypothetical protein SAMN04488518_102469 [Pseudovibrio ascidiaceicola]|uniref:Uncharacterized protein n=1 Tax=Pseudovibrio ascidiaceicola TaxID=285279 RepID=A0A1I3XA15_9HYPH|nr:hypothetical protein [Pseudovibrio ascidiaceicola]SFK16465.1 hypothetical protein SAMN04488518_102469 [Pseudovibrio ascidiaceicola]